MLLIGLNSEIKSRKLYEHSTYTVGTVIKKTIGRWGEYVHYRYSNKGEEFVSSQMIENNNIRKGQIYYVVFQLDKPKNSRLLTDKPLIGNVDNVPLNGWDELPL